jgi:predicted DNA-binding transcriptional regulator YafY
MLSQSLFYKKLMIHSLDRVQNIRITTKKFKLPKDFNPEEYFDDNYGIIADEKPCIIEIKVNNTKQKYLNTLPLHHSQKEIEHTPEYSIFRYYIRPTYDFVQEILSHRDEVEVLSPPSFRNEIAEIVRNMNSLYI